MPRRRWVYTNRGQPLPEPVEVDLDHKNTFGPSHKSEAEVYGDAHATDGADISSKKKLRTYLKDNGLAHASDYAPDYAERLERARDLADDKRMHETVERAFYEHTKGSR